MDKILSVVGFILILGIFVTIFYLKVVRKRVWGRFPLYPDEKILYEEDGIKLVYSLRGEARKTIYFNSGFKISNKRFFVISGKNYVLHDIEYEKQGTDKILKAKFYIPKKDFKFIKNKSGESILKIKKPIDSLFEYNLEVPTKNINAVKRALKINENSNI